MEFACISCHQRINRVPIFITLPRVDPIYIHYATRKESKGEEKGGKSRFCRNTLCDITGDVTYLHLHQWPETKPRTSHVQWFQSRWRRPHDVSCTTDLGHLCHLLYIHYQSKQITFDTVAVFMCSPRKHRCSCMLFTLALGHED